MRVMLKTAAVLLALVGTPAAAGPFGSDLYVGGMISTHGDTCHGCRSTHPTARLQWDGGLGAPWADLTVGYFQNSKNKASFYVGGRLHRDLGAGFEAELNFGLATGYEHLTGLPVSPLAMPGIRWGRISVMGAPMVTGSGKFYVFGAVNVDVLKF